MDQYSFIYKYENEEIRVVVTKEAWQDKDCLDKNQEAANSIASFKIASRDFSRSGDAYNEKYILITSADVEHFRKK